MCDMLTLSKSSVHRLMQVCKYTIEKDLMDKFGALEIDNTCATLTENSPELGFHEEAVKIQTK